MAGDDAWRRVGDVIDPAEIAAKRAGLVARAKLELLIDALLSDDLTRPDCIRVLACALEDMGAGMPEGAVLRDMTRADAQFWASCATPHELEAYCAAALQAIEAAPMAERMAKRLLVAAWQRLGPTERARFLGKVDPAGNFRGK